MLTNNLDDVEPVKTITIYESILEDFSERVTAEEKKYPLSDREKLFVNTITEILTALDRSRRR